jgi:hypothetical protein
LLKTKEFLKEFLFRFHKYIKDTYYRQHSYEHHIYMYERVYNNLTFPALISDFEITMDACNVPSVDIAEAKSILKKLEETEKWKML